MDKKTFDQFTLGYIECALWINDPRKMQGEWYQHDGAEISDIDAATLDMMEADCLHFQKSESRYGFNTIDIDLYRAGMDFFLTRNGHGSGFWDGRWEEKEGKRLTAVSKAYGSFDLYIGDDGKYYGA